MFLDLEVVRSGTRQSSGSLATSATWSGGDRQFFVTMRQVILRKVEPVELLHCRAHGRGRSIGADDKAAFDRHRVPDSRWWRAKRSEQVSLASLRFGLHESGLGPAGDEFEFAGSGIEIRAAMREMQGDTGIASRRLDKQQIQASPRNGMQGFAVVFAVRLKCERAVAGMDHPPAHQNAGLHDIVGEAD